MELELLLELLDGPLLLELELVVLELLMPGCPPEELLVDVEVEVEVDVEVDVDVEPPLLPP